MAPGCWISVAAAGILAIAALKLGASRAIGIDLDPEAERVAGANAQRNGVSDRSVFITGEAFDLAPLLGPADLVLSNILRSQNVRLLPVIRAVLASGGVAVLAGMERAEEKEFRAALDADGFTVLEQVVDEGWWGVAVRPE